MPYATSQLSREEKTGNYCRVSPFSLKDNEEEKQNEKKKVQKIKRSSRHDIFKKQSNCL